MLTWRLALQFERIRHRSRLGSRARQDLVEQAREFARACATAEPTKVRCLHAAPLFAGLTASPESGESGGNAVQVSVVCDGGVRPVAEEPRVVARGWTTQSMGRPDSMYTWPLPETHEQGFRLADARLKTADVPEDAQIPGRPSDIVARSTEEGQRVGPVLNSGSGLDRNAYLSRHLRHHGCPVGARAGRGREGAEQVHRENHYYGHAETLSRFAGLARPRSIAGYVQHGWQHGTGVVPDCANQRWPKLIWSRRNLDACLAAGVREPRPIGAPFLYLPPTGPVEPAKGKASLLALPYHGWSGAGVLAVEESYRTYARALAEVLGEGFGRVTVCLFWREFEDPGLRAVFEAEGFEVVTVGNGLVEPDFLVRLRDLILEHAHVTSNRIATATFYALAVNRPFFRFGPPMRLDAKGAPSGEDVLERERKEFPSLLHERYEGRVEAEIARFELGAEYKLEPEALSRALQWDHPGLLARVSHGFHTRAWCASRGLWRTVRGLARRARSD